MIGTQKAIVSATASSSFQNFAGDWKSTPLSTNANLYEFVNPNSQYTHALNFGQQDSKTINGVTFSPIPGFGERPAVDLTAPSTISPVNYGTASPLNIDADDLGNCFVFGAPFFAALKGLSPKTFYRVAFYHYAWDGSENGNIQTLSEALTGKTINFARARYSIYWIDLFLDSATATFNFTADSHLYALTCQKL